jgi:hypothetical protein
MADVRYDPAAIQEFANALYARARSILVVCIVVATIVGAGAGLIVAGQFNSLLIGVLAFALVIFVGVLIGRGLGYKYKLAAQLALCQVQTEVNTRGAGAARSIA